MDEFTSLLMRCHEIREWHKTGILRGEELRLKAIEIENKFGVAPGIAIQIAERNTADEAMDYLLKQNPGFLR